MDEKELVKKAKLGDKQAFCRLYMQYKDRLYRYAYFKLGNKEDAQDAVSNCIAEAFEHIGSLKNDRAFCAWIFKIIYRSCCSLIKEQIQHNKIENIDSVNNFGRAFYFMEYENAELHEALGILADEDKDIVLLAAVAGYSSKEIAKLTGLKSGTVRSKLSRSLAKMRDYLE